MVKDEKKLSEIEGKGGKVDKEPDGATQIVRAVTKTDDQGRYEFKSYIAGDYAVRFVYGGSDSTIYSKISHLIQIQQKMMKRKRLTHYQ